jgi:transcription elongation factor GreA
MSSREEPKVEVGSSICVRWGDQHEREEYTIVPAHDADWQRAMISDASPFGLAVLGRLRGETVTIKVASQRCQVTIVAVRDSRLMLRAEHPSVAR